MFLVSLNKQAKRGRGLTTLIGEIRLSRKNGFADII
jgi:hypothetical protein